MRTIRQTVPFVVYHLISRFVDRDWFLADEEERERYLKLLGRAMRESDWRCLAYALMSSHIHLAMVAGVTSLASWIKRVHSPFVDWMNIRHDRIGPMFVRGPRDYAVPPDRVCDLIAYIHNNPVRAGVVETASNSTWTSHRAYVGLVQPPSWLGVAEGLAMCQVDGADFEAFVSTNPGDPCRVDVRGVRRAVTKLGQIEVGTPNGDTGDTPLLVRPGAHVRIDPGWFVAQTAGVFRISQAELCSKRRNPTITAARNVAVHAALAFGVSGSDIAAALALTTGAVSQIRLRGISARTELDIVISRVRAIPGATKNRPYESPLIAGVSACNYRK